jgi:hypothetical protein
LYARSKDAQGGIVAGIGQEIGLVGEPEARRFDFGNDDLLVDPM